MQEMYVKYIKLPCLKWTYGLLATLSLLYLTCIKNPHNEFEIDMSITIRIN